jgi:site-specific DNA-methyltransferase (adenine-specific)
MDGAKADILITDPPYNIDYEGKTKDALKIQNDKMDNDSFRQFLVDAFTCANEVMRGGAVFYIWHSDSEGYNFRGACNDVGWKVRECLIWNKNCMVMGRQDYQWKHEPCLYGWKDGASHLWASDRKQTTVLDFARPIRNDIHPTMKPVALFAYQISNNTHEGDAVLDIFGGSSSTLIACEQLGRRCYMCELDEHYVDVIVKRYIDFTNNKDDVYVIRDGQKIKYSEI